MEAQLELLPVALEQFEEFAKVRRAGKQGHHFFTIFLRHQTMRFFSVGLYRRWGAGLPIMWPGDLYFDNYDL
jgi:hypothetical protein